MDTKNDVKVSINGKEYTLSGYESSEYLQRIAAYINSKTEEFKASGYLKFDKEMQNVVMNINLADDYFKAQKSAEDLKKQNEDLEKEIFDLKLDLITVKSNLEKSQKENEELVKNHLEDEKKLIRYEAENTNKKDDNKSESENDSELRVVRDNRKNHK